MRPSILALLVGGILLLLPAVALGIPAIGDGKDDKPTPIPTQPVLLKFCSQRECSEYGAGLPCNDFSECKKRCTVARSVENIYRSCSTEGRGRECNSISDCENEPVQTYCSSSRCTDRPYHLNRSCSSDSDCVEKRCVNHGYARAECRTDAQGPLCSSDADCYFRKCRTFESRMICDLDGTGAPCDDLAQCCPAKDASECPDALSSVVLGNLSCISMDALIRCFRTGGGADCLALLPSLNLPGGLKAIEERMEQAKRSATCPACCAGRQGDVYPKCEFRFDSGAGSGGDCRPEIAGREIATLKCDGCEGRGDSQKEARTNFRNCLARKLREAHDSAVGQCEGCGAQVFSDLTDVPLGSCFLRRGNTQSQDYWHCKCSDPNLVLGRVSCGSGNTPGMCREGEVSGTLRYECKSDCSPGNPRSSGEQQLSSGNSEQLPETDYLHSIDRAPDLGTEAAATPVGMILDFSCGVAKHAFQALKPALSRLYKDGTIKVYFIDLPLGEDPRSVLMAEAARCAGLEGKYFEYTEKLFEYTGIEDRAALDRIATELFLDKEHFAACLDRQRFRSQVEQDARDVRSIGVSGTPSFIVGNRLVHGFSSESDLLQLIQEEKSAKISDERVPTEAQPANQKLPAW